MAVCPSCSKNAFEGGWCTYCGYSAKPAAPPPRVVQGRAVSAAPVALDPSALAPLEDEPAELPMDALQIVTGEPVEALPMDALQIVEGEPLAAEAIGLEIAPIEEVEPIQVEPEEPPVPPMEGLDQVHRAGDVDVALMDGIELNEIEPREFKQKVEAAGGKAEFAYSVCPECQAQQPDPVPLFCEACGYKLKSKARSGGGGGGEGGAKKKKGKDDEDKVKCRPCGVFNKADAGSCINCGSKLKLTVA